jgi:hypothetical protein
MPFIIHTTTVEASFAHLHTYTLYESRVRVSVQWRVFCSGKWIRHEHFDWNLMELMLCA